MKQKTTLILTFVMALAVGITANAGNTHDHPIRADKAVALMTDVFGYTPGSGTTTIYEPQQGGGWGLAPQSTKYSYQSSTGRTQTYILTWEYKGLGYGDYKKNSDGTYTWVGFDSLQGDYVVKSATKTDWEGGPISGHYPAGYLKGNNVSSHYYEMGEGQGSYAQVTVPSSWTKKTKSQMDAGLLKAGDVVLVKVNDYWRGQYKYISSDASADDWSSYWENCYYGVSDVSDVISPNPTPSGNLYAYKCADGELLRRFFFIKRRTNDAKKGYFLDWFDEWSTIPDSDGGWSDYAKNNQYAEHLDKGEVWYAPHNCSNSLEKNHFIPVINEGDETNPNAGEQLTVLYYVSNNAPTDTKGSSSSFTKKPFLCLYRAEQVAPTVTKVEASTGNTYDVSVNFNSTFAKAKAAMAQRGYDEVMWNNQRGGVKEYYLIEINDPTHPDKEPILVCEDDLNKVGDYYRYFEANYPEGTDEWFPQGYDITYTITAKLYNVTAGGVRDEEPIIIAPTKSQTVHIPGTENMWLEGTRTSNYVPSNFNTSERLVKYNTTTVEGEQVALKSYNEVVYTITGITSNTHVLEANEYVVLYKSFDKTNWTEFRVFGEQGQTLIALVNQTFTDSYNESCDATQGAYYKMELRKTGVTDPIMYSNILEFKAKSAQATKRAFYRQGHPDDYDGFETETVHNELKFTPDKADIAHYWVYLNGDATTRTKIFKEQYLLLDEYVHQKELEVDPFINEYESNQQLLPANSFFAVVAEDYDGNTYGSGDIEFRYDGSFNELVFQVQAQQGKKEAHNIRAGYASFGISVGFKATFSPNSDDQLKAKDITGDEFMDKFVSIELFGEYRTGQSRATSEVRPVGISATEDANHNFVFSQYFDKTIEEAGLAGKDVKKDEGEFKEATKNFFEEVLPMRVYAKLTFLGGKVRYTDWAAIPTPAGGGSWTGIDGVTDDEAKVAVYPNPATDFITVEGANGNVALYNASGAMVQSVNAQGTVTIDVTGLSKGVYFLKTGNVTEKILIK